MNLVRFECGCIGFAPEGDSVHSLLLVVCDRDMDDDEYGLSRRDMSKTSKDTIRPYTPITDQEEIGQHITRIRNLMHDGYKYQQIRSLLK